MGRLFGAFAVAALPLLLFFGGPTRLSGQEIIVNGTFNTNVSSWSLDPGVGHFDWSPDGSLLLVNDASPPGQTASVSQCDSISGGVFYDFSARVQPVNFSSTNVSGPRRLEHTGTMYVLLDFFPLANCAGSGLPQFVRVSSGGQNLKWETLGQTFLSPASAASVLTSLAISKDQAGSDLQGYFDDISIAASGGPPAPPVANFSFTPPSPSVGQAVEFMDASSGAPTSWSWDFGDPSSGSANTSTLQNQAHIFSGPSTYTVTLTVSNLGGTNSKSRPVTVVVAPPVANFSFAPSAPIPGQTVQFTDSSSGFPTSWSWTFGDPGSRPNTSTLQNPTHVFTAPGVYPIALTATNAGGTGNRNHAVTVVAGPPVASFTFTPSSPSPGQTVQFLDSSSGAPTSWSWNFGDPGSGAANASTSQNPTHTFAAAGIYTVTLAASNAVGTGTQTVNITVKCFRCPRVVTFR